MTNPFDQAELYEKMNLAGVLSPGQVVLSGHKRAQKWDVKEASGNAGATTTNVGASLAQFTATFALVRDDMLGVDEFEEWNVFVEYLMLANTTKPPKAFDVYHPDLALLRISSVVVASIGGVVHDGKGGATVVVEFLEYSPPKKAGGSPKGSKSKGKDEVDPNGDIKQQVDIAVAQAQAIDQAP